MEDRDLGQVFSGAVRLLPEPLRSHAEALPPEEKAASEEIRLRAGWPASVLLPSGERPILDKPVTPKELNGLLDLATEASIHTQADSIRSGFVTAFGGYRVGLCGSAAVSDGKVIGFRSLTSAAIRIPHQVRGFADPIMGELVQNGRFCSALILSPPGVGKTTLLRDVVRQLSDGYMGRNFRMGLADERGEVAAVWDGRPQMDVGRTTDILDGCPKDEAVMMLLRSMNPEIIALDEITQACDIGAVSRAAGCGAGILATAHAWDPEDLKRRKLYRELLELGIFRVAVVIGRTGHGRTLRVSSLGSGVEGNAVWHSAKREAGNAF